MPNTSKRVVVVGGGLGGLMLATRLGRHFSKTREAEVSLVDRAAVHIWKPMLHSFAAGTANAGEDGIPFLAQARRAGFTYFPGEFYALDRETKEIAIRMEGLGGAEPDTTTLPYDILVIAIGGGSNDFGTPGVREHCHFIDNLWGAEKLNAALRREIIKSGIRGTHINVAIVGGGATGVEFAADTARLVDVGSAYSGIDLRRRLKLTLLDASERILSAFPADLSRQVTQSLQDLGVDVQTNVKVARADKDGFDLAEGKRVLAEVKVWAAGVKPAPPFADDLNLKRSASGHIALRPTLQTQSDPSIFALGDCSQFTPEGAERPLPPTGQVARQQADHLAKAVPAYIRGDELPRFTYRDSGSLISLSQYGAYGSISGIGPIPSLAIKGWFAKRAHRVFYRVHQFGLYGPLSGMIVLARDQLNSGIRPPVRFD
ncbi:MAG: FAD-dependent oxidoreductase [Pseudomonadota bacterium]